MLYFLHLIFIPRYSVSHQICDLGSLNIFESQFYLKKFKVSCEVKNFLNSLSIIIAFLKSMQKINTSILFDFTGVSNANKEKKKIFQT